MEKMGREIWENEAKGQGKRVNQAETKDQANCPWSFVQSFWLWGGYTA